MRTTWKKLETALQFSFAYHPQIDGKTKVVNRGLGNMLRCLVGERPVQLDSVLTQAKFTYNKSINISTCKCPFQIVNWRSPRRVVDLSPLRERSQMSENA